MGQPGLFLLFFQTRITIFTTNKCKECPSSIRCWDLNSRPLEHESPLITTRPGFLPYYLFSLKYFPIYKTAILTCRLPVTIVSTKILTGENKNQMHIDSLQIISGPCLTKGYQSKFVKNLNWPNQSKFSKPEAIYCKALVLIGPSFVSFI